MKEGLSIIIPAYKSASYIQECLNSIAEQTYFKNFDEYEILIGADACEETLEKLKEIKNNYRNLRVFMMDSNKGPYVTKNSLIPLAQYDIIQFFDSDDIMLPHMIEENMEFIKDHEFVSNQFEHFSDGATYIPYGKPQIAAGIVMIQKKVLKKLGGFKDWPCSADSDFNVRASKIKEWSRKKHHRTSVKVRIHDGSLTNKKSTRQGSEIRNKYNEMLRMCHLTPEIYTRPVTNNYKEI